MPTVRYVLIDSPAGGVLCIPVPETIVDVTAAPYDATGDGTTDDSAAIQAAIDDYPGDVVFFPAGDYRIGTTLAVASDATTLRGAGPSSILRLMDDLKVSVLAIPAVDISGPLTTVRPVGVTIEDLTISGNYNPIAESGVEPDYFPILVRQAEDLTIARVTVTDTSSDGITVSNGNMPSVGLVIEDCRVKARRSGIHVGFADGATIRRCLILDTPDQHYGPSAANGIDVEVEGYDLLGADPHLPYVRNLTIEDNLIGREGGATSGCGIALQPAYGPLSGVTIARNVIHGHQLAIASTGSLDIYGEAAGVHDLTIADNWLYSKPGTATSGYPMSLAGASGVTVGGNVMNDGTASGNFSNGPFVGVVGSELVMISGNTVRLVQSVANELADITSASDTVAVTGNAYQTHSDALVTDDGTATNVTTSGNTILGPGTWDRTAPTCAFAGGLSGSTVSAPATITVTAAGAARVFFQVDGVPAGQDSVSPFAFAFDPADHAAGEHTLSAIAVDAAGNVGEEASATITTA